MDTCQILLYLYYSIVFHTHTSHLQLYTVFYDLQLCGCYIITQGTWADLSQGEKKGFYIPKYRRFVCNFYFQAAVDKIIV